MTNNTTITACWWPARSKLSISFQLSLLFLLFFNLSNSQTASILNKMLSLFLFLSSILVH